MRICKCGHDIKKHENVQTPLCILFECTEKECPCEDFEDKSNV